MSAASSQTEFPMPQTAIDLVPLARQTGGDAELERELLTLFAQQCARHLRTIHGGDAAARRDAAHTLKGAARAPLPTPSTTSQSAAGTGTVRS